MNKLLNCPDCGHLMHSRPGGCRQCNWGTEPFGCPTCNEVRDRVQYGPDRREKMRTHYTWLLTHYGTNPESEAARKEYLAALKEEPAGELSLQELKDLVHLLETGRESS